MLGRYDRALRARGPVGRLTLLQQAIAAIRRNNGALFYVPDNFAGSWTDSSGTDPVNEVADVIGRMTDRTGGSAVATQSTTASKPTVQTNAQGFNVVRFDGSNDHLVTNITTGNEGWVCAGVSPTALNIYVIVSNGGASNTNSGVRLMLRANGDLWLNASNGTTVANAAVVAAYAAGGVYVVDGGWKSGQAAFAAVNGVAALGAITSDPTSATALCVGATLSPALGNYFSGNLSAQVICPVLPSAADRAIIRKWIGSLQGQTL